MKILLVGVGGVGEAIATIAKSKDWVNQIVLADYNLNRAKEVQAKLGEPGRFPVEFVDASQQKKIEDLANKYQVDLTMSRSSMQPITPARLIWTWR
jgi:saccharopine dehydrogenase-like NADP-dependent oxidoreductase